MPLTKIGRWSVFGAVLTLELAGIGFSYAVWTRCNNSQGNFIHVSPLVYIGNAFLFRVQEVDVPPSPSTSGW